METSPVWEASYAQWVDRIIRAVADLPDRTSPEDDPTTILVSEGELRDILWGNLPPDRVSEVAGLPHSTPARTEQS